MKSDFLSCQGLVRMGWGPKWECHNPSRFWNRDNIWYRSFTKKSNKHVVKFRAQKYSCAVSWKVIFCPVKDLFEWVEVLGSSVIILVGSETEIIFDIGHLRKKYLTRCQISSSKILLCSFMKSDFQSCQGLVRMGWGPKWECHNPSRFWNRDNIWYRSFTKKVISTLSNSELKKYSCAVSWKVIFCPVKDLFKWVEVLSGSVIILVGSGTEIIFDIGHLRKK